MRILSLHARATLGIPEAQMTGGSTWFRLGAIAVLAGLLGVACTDGLTDLDADLRVTVTPEVSTLASLGEQVQLGAKVDVTRGAAPSPVWLTRNVDVAAVGDDGRVRAIGNGETWIVALVEADGLRAADSARITVAQVPVDVRVDQVLDTLTWFGQTARLAAVAQDARGNPVADAALAWTSSDPAAVRVDSAGTVTAVAEGAATITVSVGEVSASITLAVAQEVTSVTVAPTPASITVGGTQQFTATARDAGGTTVAGVKFLWVSGNVNVAVVDTAGLARGTGAGTVTITAVGRGEPGNAVLNVGSVPSTPTQLAFSVQPSTSTAGQALSPAVEVEIRDANNNLVTSARNAVTLAFGANPAGGTLAGTKTVTAINGIASFSGLWIDKAAAGYTLTATAAALTGATSGAFTVNPGAPTRLTFGQQPSAVEGNAVMAPAVTVTVSDAFDNVVTTATNSVTLDFGVNVWKSVFSPGAALLGTRTVNAVNGVAPFGTLRVDKPGTGYTLAATAAGLTPGSSDAFPVALTVQSVNAAKLGEHTCAVGSSGPWCWGYGGNGQLGDSTGTVSQDSVARLVRGGLTFTQIVGGQGHSCGLTAAGAAYCWGYNGYGQLGNNSTTSTRTPVAVSGSHTFSSLAAGVYHTCGVVGTSIRCWGADFSGQLGDDVNYTSQPTPVQVVGSNWAAVSAGGEHTCGRTTGGDLYCWGADWYGMLGDDINYVNQPTPVVVAGGRTWANVDAGYYHTCGVDASGVGYCWGYNSGRLGADTVTYPPSVQQPTPVPVFGGLTWATIKVGYGHSCGLLANGAAYCWGENYDGQLGNGTFDLSYIRVAVSGGLTFNSLSVGGSHTCGRVGTAVWCWGYNGSGQLGDGSRLRKAEPVQIVQ
jgi:alpha-tubulin suppressor-like RCC1 family protein